MSYRTRYQHRHLLDTPKKRPRRRLVFVMCLAVVVGVSLGAGIFTNDLKNAYAAHHQTAPQLATPMPNVAIPAPSTLDPKLAKTIAAHPSLQIGVAVQNVSSGQNETFGLDLPFEAASTAKIIAACAYYHLVEQGRQSLDEPMGSFDAGFELQEMINQSDNDAWAAIVGTIGIDNLAAYARSIGVSYDVDNNTLSPTSLASVLTQLYNGKLLDTDDTTQLLGYMQNTNNELLIPAVIPAGTTVYHKYGQLDGELHDAAIIHQGSRTYAVVIYTKGADDGSAYGEQTTAIHDLASTIIDTLKL